ncbi:MAG: hypothetical protein ACQKHC_02890 [Candidatus Phytoplasma pruni]|uniref:hypothetical protein n=1 Tax=Milkweed yellows phytoplasma TaxID=208434 RepID=UPI000373B261|nr:hypothetical protein [Milkweed yellows phytoplasma]
MRNNNNLLDNFICLLMGSIVGIFIYVNFFLVRKEIPIEENNNLVVVQQEELILEVKNSLLDYNDNNYLYKKDIVKIINKIMERLKEEK